MLGTLRVPVRTEDFIVRETRPGILPLSGPDCHSHDDSIYHSDICR